MIVTIVSYTQEFTIEISEQESVLEIKKRLGQFLHIPTSSLTLFVSCWELFDGLDIEDYPIISHGTRIDLTVTHLFTAPSFINPAVKKIHVTIKFPSKQFTIEVDRTETVSSLKDKIHIVENTPIKRMQLYYSGIELADDFRNLNEYGIREFSEIVVFLKSINRTKDVAPMRKLCFLVQTSSSLYNGARIPVEIKDSCTISEMREGLQVNKTLPRDEYIFVHKQRIMRENCSLRWHGVENGDTLFVFKGSVSRGDLVFEKERSREEEEISSNAESRRGNEEDKANINGHEEEDKAMKIDEKAEGEEEEKEKNREEKDNDGVKEEAKESEEGDKKVET